MVSFLPQLFIDLSQVQFLQGWILWGIPIAAIILFFLLTRDFVRLPLLPEERRRQRRQRVFVFITRLLIISLILAALAQPYVQRTQEIQGNPRVTLLIDQSGSMAYFNTSFANSLAQTLQRSVPTTVRTMGSNLTSDLGDAMLRNLEPGGNLFLITDGNVNSGTTLDDAAFYANSINASISVINLTSLTDEAAVVVNGPSEVVAQSDATFHVSVTSTNPQRQVHLVVTVDGATALEQDVLPGTYAFTKQFEQGSHRIEAHITTPDANPDNNDFYKVVNVLPKPRILLLTQHSTPLELILRDLYDVDKESTLPQNLSQYYAVVVDDMPVEALTNTQLLHDYLIDQEGQYYGNGLVFFGGLNSFDRGGYAGSSLEPLLPVRVGQGQRNKGGSTLLFVVDVSGSMGNVTYTVQNGQLVAQTQTVSPLDVVKAQTVNAVEQLDIANKVGVIAFGIPPGAKAQSEEEAISDTIKIIDQPDYLYNNRKDILDRVPRIIGGGPTVGDVALRAAVDMLQNVPGDKNIVLLSNGRYSIVLGDESPAKQQMLDTAANAHQLYGINFMTIGVGTDSPDFSTKVDEQFLKQLAAAGDGTYDRATQLNSLIIKWGDPKAKDFGQNFGLVLLSLTHFITQGVEPTAILNSYNQVVPKDTANLLITSDSGEPALTVWQYGNGRVATWTVFAGGNLGELLNSQNSILISRTVNWAIGDPERKEPFYVTIPDTRINDQGFVTVHSPSPVTAEGLVFTKDGNTYTAQFAPTKVGFATLLSQDYAVNRPSEYDVVGMNPDLEKVAADTGGKVFKPSDSDAMIQQIQQTSRRVTVVKNPLSMPFIVAAMVLLLLEIATRRITERRRGS